MRYYRIGFFSVPFVYFEYFAVQKVFPLTKTTVSNWRKNGLTAKYAKDSKGSQKIYDAIIIAPCVVSRVPFVYFEYFAVNKFFYHCSSNHVSYLASSSACSWACSSASA